MDNFEEALRNIDVFCKVLVDKMAENTENTSVTIEPMENLLQRKYIMPKNSEPNPTAKHFIPLSQAEEPLIDVFEDDEHIKVFMQCRCKDQKVTVQPETDGLKICKRECHTDEEGVEICTDKCQKLDVSPTRLQIENMNAKCSNNVVYEISIPKTKS